MRLVNPRALWVLEGMHIHTIPAKEPVSRDFMSTLFPGMKKSAPIYKHVERAAEVDRVLLIKPNNSIVIVPMTPDVYVDERNLDEEDHE